MLSHVGDGTHERTVCLLVASHFRDDKSIARYGLHMGA
jgi:hypothetical protein